MRVLAILALGLLALALVPSPASASAQPGVPVHVEFVQCVRAPCPPIVWCDPSTTYNGVVVERNHDCSHRVSADFIDCIFGEHWVTYTVGPVTVRYTECNQPDETSSAQAAPGPVCVMAPCGPGPIVPTGCSLQSKTPPSLTVGPVVVGGVRERVWGTDTSECDVDVEPAYYCVGGWGTDVQRDVAFVDATVRACDGGLVDRVGEIVGELVQPAA